MLMHGTFVLFPNGLVKLTPKFLLFIFLSFLKIDRSQPSLRCQIKFSLLHQISDFEFLFGDAKIRISDQTLERGAFIYDVTDIGIRFDSILLLTPRNNEPLFLSGFLKCSQTCFTIQRPTKDPNVDVVKLSLFRHDCI